MGIRVKGQLKRYFLLALIFLIFGVPGEWASGSQPVRAIITGCVIEGFFISRESTLDTERGPRTSQGANFIRVQGLNLGRYEGQVLRLTGFLHPGDLFYTSEPTLEMLSLSCDVASIPNFNLIFSWACRTMARERLAAKVYEEALRYINRAIEVDPAECEFYVTREEIFAAQGFPHRAAADQKQAAPWGCRK